MYDMELFLNKVGFIRRSSDFKIILANRVNISCTILSRAIENNRELIV